jgi:hypothetical protein
MELGIWKREQYLALGEKRRYSGPRVAYTLLRVSEDPSEEEIATFEDINFTLQTANGIFRTTFRGRFAGVDTVVSALLGERYGAQEELRVEDRAASNGLTSYEWALKLHEQFPRVKVTSSDILQNFYELDAGGGEVYVVEPNGTPLQYIKPPFVVPLGHLASWKYPLIRIVGYWARRKFAGLRLGPDWKNGGSVYPVRRLECVHPEGLRFGRRTGALAFEVRSVFEASDQPCHVVRTMNILNRAYFDEGRLKEGIEAAHQSLVEGGLWVVGRTMEDDFSNHVSILEKQGAGWKLLQRIGKGSEVEGLALTGAGR